MTCGLDLALSRRGGPSMFAVGDIIEWRGPTMDRIAVFGDGHGISYGERFVVKALIPIQQSETKGFRYGHAILLRLGGSKTYVYDDEFHSTPALPSIEVGQVWAVRQDPTWTIPGQHPYLVEVGDKFLVTKVVRDWIGRITWVAVTLLNGDHDLLLFLRGKLFCLILGTHQSEARFGKLLGRPSGENVIFPEYH